MIDTFADLDEPAGILAALGSVRCHERAVELAKARLVLAWVDAHPGDHLDEATEGTGRSVVLTWHDAETARPRTPSSLGGERALQPAGMGTPLVAEFCFAELAAALEMSHEKAKRLAGDLLELRQRLPRCWARVRDLEVPLWRARRVAALTLDLTPEGAGEVDRSLAAFLHTVGPAAVERAVAAARWLHDPDEAADLAHAARETRDVRVWFGSRSGVGAGTAEVTATIDHLDAVDFERAVAAGAAALAAGGSTETLAVRRARAVGVIARGEVTLTFPAPGTSGTGETATTLTLPPASREVVLHVHLSEAALTSSPFAPGRAGAAAEVEQGALRLTPADVVRGWCGAGATTRITVRPVLDPSEDVGTDAYAPTTRLVELVLARDGGCVFPACGRPARGCDLDHVIPYGAGGPTHSQNLAPLCRLHHRLKTHGGWTYRRIPDTPGGIRHGAEYEWASPHGQRFLVTTATGHPPRTRRLAARPGSRLQRRAPVTIEPLVHPGAGPVPPTAESSARQIPVPPRPPGSVFPWSDDPAGAPARRGRARISAPAPF